MGLFSKVAGTVTKAVTTAVKGKIKPKVLVNGELVPFKKGKQIIKSVGEKIEYQIKPDITMPISPSTLKRTKPVIRIRKNVVTGVIDDAAKAEMGNVSVRLAKTFKGKLRAAEKEIKAVFKGFDVEVRAKGANSVYSKLEKNVLKEGKVIRSDTGASKLIGDAIGGRITMPNLTFMDITDTLRTIKIGSRSLSIREQNILSRYFRGEKLKPDELKIAQEYARPVKLALAERQSNPVVRQITLSSLKGAIEDGTTTIAKLEKNPMISPDIIQELKTNSNITPLRITELENYSGIDGIPYFTDRQIIQIRDVQMAAGRSIEIKSIPEAKRSSKSLTPLEEQALKKSGYTTAQFNAVLKDGSLAEIQVRGKAPFAEVEHIAYDSTQEKNTLSHIFDEYKSKVKDLKPEDVKAYCRYRSECYNYYRNMELGIVSPKPELPANLDKILSEESMISLHAVDAAQEAAKMENFVPHIKIVA